MKIQLNIKIACMPIINSYTYNEIIKIQCLLAGAEIE